MVAGRPWPSTPDSVLVISGGVRTGPLDRVVLAPGISSDRRSDNPPDHRPSGADPSCSVCRWAFLWISLSIVFSFPVAHRVAIRAWYRGHPVMVAEHANDAIQTCHRAARMYRCWVDRSPLPQARNGADFRSGDFRLEPDGSHTRIQPRSVARESPECHCRQLCCGSGQHTGRGPVNCSNGGYRMRAPAAATWLLKKSRPANEALLGDLLEDCRNGRSAGWYWRQVIGAIVTGVRKDIRDHPILALRAMATGWIVLLLIFSLLGDRTAEAIARYGWNWSRYEDGYGAGRWWPFWLAASCVSYGGFAISAWAVARLHGAHGMAMVTAYLGSLLVALSVSATLVELVRRPVPLPHAYDTSYPLAFPSCGIQASFWSRWSSYSRVSSAAEPLQIKSARTAKHSDTGEGCYSIGSFENDTLATKAVPNCGAFVAVNR